jgi:hypothetical protein
MLHSSDVASIIAFSPIVLLQRYISRHRISKSQYVTISKEERVKLVIGDPAIVLLVPQAREGVSRGVYIEARH